MFRPELVEANDRIRRPLAAALLGRLVDSSDVLAWVTAFLAGKATKTHEAATILAGLGFGQDAGLLVRSMLDLLVTLKWILQDPIVRAQMYVDYDAITRQRADRVVTSRPDLLGTAGRPTAEELEATRAEIDARAAEVKQKYGYDRRDRFSKKSIAEMAEEVGMTGDYDFAYRLLSNLEHSSARSSIAYLERDEKGRLSINLGPSDNYVPEVLGTAYSQLARTYLAADQVLDLGVGDILTEASVDVKIFGTPQ